MAAKYGAEFTDNNGKQLCRSLETTNVSMARRKAIKIQEKLEKGIDQATPLRITIEDLIEKYFKTVKLKGAAPKTIRKYEADLSKLRDFCHQKNIRLTRTYGCDFDG